MHAPYLPTHADYRKHLMAWKGPFSIAKEIAEDVFEVIGMEAGVPTAYHRSKLKRYHRADPDQPRLAPPPAPLKIVDGKVEYEIGEILNHRELRGKRQYLLQWKDTPESSWEWESNLSGCLDLLKEYLKRIGEEGRVLPPGLTSEVPQAPPGGSAGGAGPSDDPPARNTRIRNPPASAPLRRSARLQRNRNN